MAISIIELDGNVTKAVLSGRIDIAGAGEIDMPLSLLGGTRRAVIVDLSGVEFMASLGLRSIVMSAKAIFSKGGKAVLLSPQPAVEEVITVSGVDELIPITRSEAEALLAVTAG
ncbi:MAG TPA: STAS domain-containing protein [Acidocella sp.]|jgi:anti-sigma B factor antagonist|nr:STAS domain-containing protein [Acidocella sp.]